MSSRQWLSWRKLLLVVFATTGVLIFVVCSLYHQCFSKGDLESSGKQVVVPKRVNGYLRTSSSGSLVFVGILVAIGGQFFIASGAVLQKYTHEKLRKQVIEGRRRGMNSSDSQQEESSQTGPEENGKEKKNPTLPNGSLGSVEYADMQLERGQEYGEFTEPIFLTLRNNGDEQMKLENRAHSFDNWGTEQRRRELCDSVRVTRDGEFAEKSVDISLLRKRILMEDTDRTEQQENHVNDESNDQCLQDAGNSSTYSNTNRRQDFVSELRNSLLFKHKNVDKERRLSVTSEPARKKTLFTTSPPHSPHLSYEDIATRHGMALPNTESFRQLERTIAEHHQEDAGAVQRTHYLRQVKWWLGLLLIGGGEVCNLVAFGFAPGSTVAPLGVLVVPINTVLAWKFLKERVTWVTVGGIAVSIAGAALVGVFGPSGADSTGALDQAQLLKLLNNVAFIVFMSITVGVILAIYVINMLTAIGVRYLLVYALMSGMAAAVSVTSAKGVVQLIRYSVEGKGNQLAKPLIYVMLFILVVTIVFMVYYMNRGMQTFRVTLFLAVYYGFFMTFSVVGSILMDQEYRYITAYNAPFFIGIGFILIGISIISFSSRPQEAEEEEAEFLEALRRYWETHGSHRELSHVQENQNSNDRTWEQNNAQEVCISVPDHEE